MKISRSRGTVSVWLSQSVKLTASIPRSPPNTTNNYCRYDYSTTTLLLLLLPLHGHSYHRSKSMHAKFQASMLPNNSSGIQPPVRLLLYQPRRQPNANRSILPVRLLLQIRLTALACFYFCCHCCCCCCCCCCRHLPPQQSTARCTWIAIPTNAEEWSQQLDLPLCRLATKRKNKNTSGNAFSRHSRVAALKETINNNFRKERSSCSDQKQCRSQNQTSTFLTG